MAIKDLVYQLRIKGAKKTKDELKGVDNSVKSLAKSALKAGAAFIGTAGLVNALRESVRAFAQQEAAERSLEAALGRTSQSLLDQASALQKVSLFGDEAIIVQQAFLASLEFSEEQIRKIIEASIDLSAATGISLESAVRNTAKTFSGLAGELGELIPQLRELTAEQMKAGDAVKLISELFGGLAEEETKTLSGQVIQLQNAFGDLSEKFGERFLAKSVRNLTSALKELAEEIGDEDSGVNKALSFLNNLFNRTNPLLDESIDKINKETEARRNQREEIEKIGKGEQLQFTKEQEAEIGAQIFTTEKRTFELRREGLKGLELQEVKFVEINSNAEKLKEHAAQTASSLFTSAVMGDNIGESLKRAVIQLGVMVAQAKIYNAIMNSAGLFTGGGIIGGITKFLFGQSPTQASPSPNITINQTFQGGMVDHNFAANNLIPAINKAISTGQARINR